LERAIEYGDIGEEPGRVLAGGDRTGTTRHGMSLTGSLAATDRDPQTQVKGGRKDIA